MVPNQQVAVIGGGIAGLATAWLLSKHHRVTLYEANDYVGGHTHTVDVTLDGITHPVDTGFLVCNDLTYPNLLALFETLGVALHPSEMTFGVSVDQGRIEWAGHSLGGVFAQKRNLLRPAHWGMLRDILRFNQAAAAYLDEVAHRQTTLGELLAQHRYGQAFCQHYLLPMAAAIWSSSPGDILQFPAATFLRFCLNHHLLQINDRPQWRTVRGGGRCYVEKMLPAIHQVRHASPVRQVVRHEHGALVSTDSDTQAFDCVVLAGHAPDMLRLLADTDEAERKVLGAFRYQPNKVWLHTDPALLPRNRAVWSAWNYLAQSHDAQTRAVCVSYLINRLQPLPFSQPVVVTLNPFSPPAPEHTLAQFDYDHPLFDNAAIAAQAVLPQLQGHRHTWFAGAWTRYGFHEDGLRSALKVAADFACLPAWARLEEDHGHTAAVARPRDACAVAPGH